MEELKSTKFTIVPNEQDLTQLEKQDALIQRQRRLMKQGVQLKLYKPHSPGRRWYRAPINDHLHKGKPYKKLTVALRSSGGRNNQGRITIRGRGGGHKRRYRLVDFKRFTRGIHNVLRIEYDPSRTCHIALIENKETGAKSYVLAADGLRAGDEIESFRLGIPEHYIAEMGGKIDPALLAAKTNKRGNCLPLHMVPLGAVIHSIGLKAKGGPGQLCRAAGTYGRLLAKVPNKKRAIVRLSSGEHRYVPLNACATLGVVSNPGHQMGMRGKAGRSRWRGFRPKVRGVAQNRCDHPHGGGRGKSKSKVTSRSPWGVLAKNHKTRTGKHANKEKIKDRPRKYVDNNRN
ncbi:hypothetical protein BABINDRAFT_59541 [Babjeviella inositovora NRRL Y-12698]|uniref:Large ribosomal subunit protein uL2m n=1 Tax=Babjeviella inositovora NRRL Y-12698 TaxID=984486 RepID=A0A1E3QTM0_9ASCO|nr:uncharacterized protein BABINDRAFT_59541 [Babjeviella inositovora NRRL Y-12698]ODQ81029.1 hypothetical protein BABINDRAFT_59541 [Babjeviella inositovora NRRL Y-12698]